MHLLFRQYVDKKLLFQHMKANDGVTKKKEIACAKDLLDDAARVRNVTEEAALAANIYQRKSSNISSDVTDDELRRNATHQGFIAQANYVVNNDVNLRQYTEFERAVSILETEQGGGTMTRKYGNIADNRKAMQRSRNTGPRGLALMDDIATPGPGIEVASGSASVATGVGGTSLRKSPHPQLDIFTLKTTSGIDKIWSRSKGANARDLHLNVDKHNLTSDMKLSRKIAKKTAKKMKLEESGHEEIVRCMLATDGISLSQATAYENGDVTTKDGRTFCSQQAVKQFRNATDSDSDDDN